MIVGIGIDIQAVSGVEQSLAERGDAWLSVILTEREIGNLKANSKGTDSVAGRLAAKEAAIKALDVLTSDEVDWLDFEVINAASGRPEIFINGNAKGKLEQLGATNTWLSIAHSEEYAVAQVILEDRSMGINHTS